MSRLEKGSSFRSAASTSQECLEDRPRVSTNQLLRVTLLSSEWRSSKGGLSTISRELAIQFAKHPNVEVCVYLPKCSEEDKRVAGSHNVQLIEAEELPGCEPIDWLFSLPKNHLPHCVIGHGLHLGQKIPLIKRQHDCKWIQVVHTTPEELGMYKSYEEAISKGEQKHQAEVKLCELADQVVAVGPKLADAYSRYLRFSRKDQDVTNLTPSIFMEFRSVQQAAEERSTFCVLVFGRGDSEDFKLKGYDIAAQAVTELKDPSYQLMFVGAPAGKEDDMAAKLLKYGIPPSQLIVRRFKESREELAKLFCEVDLAIMPSRTEGFGLTALEALSAGLPVLVSGNSGLGDALKKVPSGTHHVVDSKDPIEWAKAIKKVRRKGRDVRLEEANLLCEKYAATYSWEAQCADLVDKMLHLTFGRSGVSRHPLTVVEYNPLHSHVGSQSFQTPTLPEVLHEGSVESRERPSKKGKRRLPSVVSQPKEHGKGRSVGSGHPLTVEYNPVLSRLPSRSVETPSHLEVLHEGRSSGSMHPWTMVERNPVHSHIRFQSFETPTHREVLHEGSVESREHPLKQDKRWLPRAYQPRDHGKGRSSGYVHPWTEGDCNPGLSWVHSQSFETPAHLEVLHEGSVESREYPLKQGKRWLPRAYQPRDHGKGSVESREHPSKKGERRLTSVVSQPKEHGKGRSVGSRHPLTVECNPVLSRVPSRSVETPSHLEVLHEGSVESREFPSKQGKRWLPRASQPRDHGKGQSGGFGHPFTMVECNPVLSNVRSQSFETPAHLEVLHEGSYSTAQPSTVDSSLSLSCGACAAPEEPVGATLHDEEEGGIKQDFCQGSVESREHPSKQGKRWLSSAVSQPKEHRKGKFISRPFRKLLKDEYFRRSKLKPLLWENTIQLPLDEVYTRLEVKWRRTSNFELTDKEIHMYEIFNLNKQEEISSCHRIFHSVFGKKRQEKVNMVLVEGSPGIGKTTLCLKIANDWARKAIPKKHDFPVFKLMLLLKCRDMDGDVMQAIKDQLLPQNIMENEKKVLLDYINNEKKQEKILIILDGLDELPQVAEQAVDKLLRRNVLSRCSVLVTSRQEKGIETRQRHDFDTLLQINGFTIEDASEYIGKHFRTVDPSQAHLLKGKRLIQAIKENIFLNALPNNPLNLLLLCIVFEDHKGELPSNRTKLYQIIYRCLLGRFCSKYDVSPVDKEDGKAKTGDEAKEDDHDFALEKQCEDRTLALGQLAWKCLLEERPSFQQKELDKLENLITNGKGVSAAKVGVVFMEASVKKLNPKNEYHFLHKTFQEFLAATYLAQLMKQNISIFDKFRLTKSDITSKYRQVFLFAAGILDKDGTIFFKHIGEILYRNWNWKSSEEDCRFLIELLNESGAPDNLTMVATVCQCIPLPQSLELSMEDCHTLRFVRYAMKASSLASNVEPLRINKLSLTKAHTLNEDSTKDLHGILENSKTLRDLVISTDMTHLLASTLWKGLSSNSSLSSLTLRRFRSIPADVADTLGKGLSLCNSLTSLKLELYSDSFARAHDVSGTGLLKSTQLESVDAEYYGVPERTAIHTFKLLFSKRSLMSFSLTLFGDMEDCLAFALSEGLSEGTTLNSFTVVIHGSLSNHGATLLANVFLQNRTLHSLVLKVLGDLPEHWTRVVDKIHELTAIKSWKSLTLHPNMKGKFVDASFPLLDPISRVGLLEKTLTINLWGELSIHNVDTLGGRLLQTSPLSSLTLNVNGKVSNDVADCLVNFFVTNNVLLSLTINLSGIITSCGQTALHRLHSEGQLQCFILNVDGLVTEDWECLSAQNNFATSSALPTDISKLTRNEVREIFFGSKSLTELSLAVDSHVRSVHNYACTEFEGWRYGLYECLSQNKSLTKFSLEVNDYGDTDLWVHELSAGLSNNKSITTFSLTVHVYTDREGVWGYGLGQVLSNNKSLTTFSLTVHDRTNTGCLRGEGLGQGLSHNNSLTTFSLTVHAYTDTGGLWGYGLGQGLSHNNSLTTFSLTVYDYADTGAHWGCCLGQDLSHNKSLTTFSLTVHDHAHTGGRWGRHLGQGLSHNNSLTTFSLTVHTYTGTLGWAYGLDESLSNNKSLTTFSLAVHNYADTLGWGYGLYQGLRDNKSLTTFSLTVHNYADREGSWGYGLVQGLSSNKSLTTFSLTVHNYADTEGSWVYSVSQVLSNNRSLATFSLTVHDYTDTSWAFNLASCLEKRCSLTTLRLAINDHTGVNRGLYHLLFKCLQEIESLTSLNISVSLYGEDIVELN